MSIRHGAELPAAKLQAVLTNGPGLDVIRHFDAGYERSAEIMQERGARVLMPFCSREN